MLRIVVTAVTFVLVVALMVVVIKKIPQAQALAGCYRQVYAIYREENIVARRAYTDTGTICGRHKRQIMSGLECFSREESSMVVMAQEIPVLRRAARVLAGVGGEPEEVIADHNNRCQEEGTQIEPFEIEAIKQDYAD